MCYARKEFSLLVTAVATKRVCFKKKIIYRTEQRRLKGNYANTIIRSVLVKNCLTIVQHKN